MTDKQNHFTYTDNTSDNNDKIMENLHKQIIIDGVDVSGKGNRHNYKLGRTKIERQQVFEDIKEMIENGFSLQNIADKYGVTRQAISLKMINCGFNVSQEVKRIKREKIKKLLEETSINNIEKLNRKVIYYKTYNIRLRNDLTELKEKLLHKEQECERLKEAGKNSRCAWKIKQALTEIKEIADLSIAHFDIDYLKQAISEILQKCEVLNEK